MSRDRHEASPYYVPNLEYGSGTYRRGVRMVNSPGEVLAELEDTHHGMRVRLWHDGERVTDIQGQTIRIPTTQCPGATLVLKRLVGTQLAMSQAELYRSAAPQLHCTHMFDLAALAIAHATRAETERRYDVTVPDETDDGAWCTISRNGETIHRWRISDETIREPAEDAGQHVLQRFIPWASRRFSGDALEAALVFQKGFFVSNARRRIYSEAKGLPIIENRSMLGVCFAYQPENVGDAYHLDSTRDFSDRPDGVLAFLGKQQGRP